MKTTIGVYDTHEKALNAIRELKKSGVRTDKLSLVGKAEMANHHIYVKDNQGIKGASISLGKVTDSVLEVLSGAGTFAIPGQGFLFGAGALVAVFAGLDMGIISGGIAGILNSLLDVETSDAAGYTEQINEGKFLVVSEGDEYPVKYAKRVLQQPHARLEVMAN